MKLKQMLIPLSGLALISLASPSYAGDNGEQYTRTFTVDASADFFSIVVAEVPTMGVVELIACFNAQDPKRSMRTRLRSFEDAQPFFGVGTVTGSVLPVAVNPAGVETNQTAGTFQTGSGSPLIANGGDLGTGGHWEYSLWREDGDNTPGAHVSIDGFNDTLNGQCHFRATVLQND